MKKLVIIIFSFTGLAVSAQEFELGGVTLKELEETKHPFDKDADAAYLYKKGKTYFDVVGGQFRTVTEVQVRLKIYTKAGYEYATVEVPYYSGRTSQKVKFSDVCTYNLVNGAIEKTKLHSEGKFDEEIVDNFKVKTVLLPNVKEGSVIEYKYVITNPFMTISDWQFQYSIPANSVEYEVAIPEYFVYSKHMRGYVKVNSYDKARRRGHGSLFNENVTVFSVKNVKAFKDESHVDNISNYMAILEHEMAIAQIPGQPVQTFATNWQSVCKQIYEDESFGKELTLKSYFEDDVAALIKDVPQDKRLDLIFSFVRDRMTWNGVETEFCNKGVKKAYLEKTGNSAEINLMLTAMLRYAGFDANPVLLSTRENGEALHPSQRAYNYVIAGVIINKEQILLDATSKNTIPGLLPVRALNWTGRLVKEKQDIPELVDLMPKKKSVEMVSVTAEIDAQGKITGKARDQYMHHFAFMFREDYKAENNDKYLDELERQHPGIEIDNFKVLNAENLLEPVGDDYSFVYNNITDVMGDKIYISPMLHFTETQNPFTAEKREYPIDFIFPHQIKYIIKLNIPEGYTVESLPSSVSYIMEENLGAFKYKLTVVGNTIQAHILYEVNYANISQEFYPTIKDFYSMMVQKQNEKIILKKA